MGRLCAIVAASCVFIWAQTVTPSRGVRAAPSDPPGRTNGKYYALIIGVNRYEHFSGLQTALNDAQTLSRVLESQFGFEVRLLVEKQATRKNILTALSQYRTILAANDNLLLYFAGHGYYDKDAGKAYWLPVDAEKDSPANWILADDLTTGVRVIPARHVLVISDSCYSGGLTRAVNAGPVAPTDGYVDRMLRARSRTLMASGGNEPVADGGGSGHSVFAGALLHGLASTTVERFTADQLFYRSIRDRVAGNAEQVPLYEPLRNSGHDDGDFVFVRRGSSGPTEFEAAGQAVPSERPASVVATPMPGDERPPAAGRPVSSEPAVQAVPLAPANCSTASSESLRLSLKGQLLPRVLENLQCRPESIADQESQAIVAHMLDAESFPTYRNFLKDLAKTSLFTPPVICSSTQRSLLTGNVDGLAWLLGEFSSGKVQSCSTFTEDLVGVLTFAPSETIAKVIGQLTSAGLSLDYDESAIFRTALEGYAGYGFRWLKDLSDITAPRSAQSFNAAKARAKAHLTSTAALFVRGEKGDMGEQSRAVIEKQMADYCPASFSFCAASTVPLPSQPPMKVSVNRADLIDNKTRLTWTASASNEKLDWIHAAEYCTNLSDGGHKDWRLPQLEEVMALSDPSEQDSGCKARNGAPITLHIRQGIDPRCGDVWTAKKSPKKFSFGGYNFDYAWLFDFAAGAPKEDPTAWIGTSTTYHHHVLCVRDSAH